MTNARKRVQTHVESTGHRALVAPGARKPAWVFACTLQVLCILPARSLNLKPQTRCAALAWTCGAMVGRNPAPLRALRQPESSVAAKAFLARRQPRSAVIPQVGGGLSLSAATSAPSEEGGAREVKSLRVHVVLPCLNEERVLPASLNRLCLFLSQQKEWEWRVTVVDNGSRDGTSNVTRAFARNEPRVSLMCLPEAGRGGALKKAWLNDTAEIQSYMDVDLSTDLEAFPSLVRCVAEGRAGIAVASRNVEGAIVKQRVPLRSITSHGLSILIRCLFWRFRVRDTQCGCKVCRRPVSSESLPLTLAAQEGAMARCGRVPAWPPLCPFFLCLPAFPHTFVCRCSFVRGRREEAKKRGGAGGRARGAGALAAARAQ
jgi:hypothetical protein